MSPPPPCLPLTREVASPKGLTEGEIGRAYGEAGCAEEAGCKFSPSVACGDSSLVRGSQGLGCSRPLSAAFPLALRQKTGYNQAILRLWRAFL